jgi:L-lactate dehydrogenase
VPAASVWGGSDVGVCEGADVVVVTAGAKQQPGQTRLDLAAANVALCRDLVPALVRTCPDALLLMVTNPVDVVTMAAQRLSGLPPHRVMGSGTVLDSARLRQLLAERCRVAVPNVHAMIAGEHGDSEIALWSLATIGGVPVRSWRDADGSRIGPDELEQILDRVRGAAYRIIAGKGATNFAIGLAGARILEAIERDERRVLPVSAQVSGTLGVDGVCLALPRIVDRNGVSEPLDIALDDDESAGIRASADAIRAVATALDVA